MRLLNLQAQTFLTMEDYDRARRAFDQIDTETSLLYLKNPENRDVVHARVRSHIEHAHAALTFVGEERVRELYLEAKELAEHHPRFLSGRHQPLLEELAERLTRQDR